MLFKSFSFLNLLLPTKDTVIPNNLCFFPPYELLIDVKTKEKVFSDCFKTSALRRQKLPYLINTFILNRINVPLMTGWKPQTFRAAIIKPWP